MKNTFNSDETFHQRPETSWSQGERVSAYKRNDNLKMEGEFVKRPDTNGNTCLESAKPQNMKKDDNIKFEGAFDSRRTETWTPGERAKSLKQSDSLHMEGDFAKR